MRKIAEFFEKAAHDDEAKKELSEIFGNASVSEASDEQLAKAAGLAARLGFEITLDELKAAARDESDLEDDELDAASGGARIKTPPSFIF